MIVLQSHWMRSQLGDLIREDADVRTLGILTDSLSGFFNLGYLTSSSVYNHVLQQWFPVLLSFMGSDDEMHMKEHFKFLIKAIQEVVTEEMTGRALDEVIDFTEAQKQAFKSAYVEVQIKQIWLDLKTPDEEKGQFDEAAQSHLKGCTFHYA